ncbi:glycosyltransferase family 4 protein [Echinicola sp. 20G]|uniref:glycosyltransferase family 4 protein n=1 Tax=Echinicola sp. 20G TaxID=2781961 RepID=UPI00191029F1|nr:MraY family glycosyltransferase [Echinicola sp. 20G]
MEVILTLTLSFITGIVVLPLVISLIKKSNIMDHPGGRKIHDRSVPSMGGIGIVLAFGTAVLINVAYEEMSQMKYVLISMGILMGVGFWDDKKELSALHKLLGQLLAFILVVVLGDIRINSLYGFLGVGELPLWLSYGLSVFMLVGLTNAYNLIDGLDGLAGILCLISCTFLGVWFLYAGFVSEGLMCLAMLGALLAFLIFNWHPAKIFMGDTGSLPLGLFLASMSIFFIQANGHILPESSTYRFQAPLASGLVMMVICCYDTLRVFVRRIRRGKSPFSPDKSHIHHFLLRMGYGHDQVALMLGSTKLLFIGVIISCSAFGDMVVLPIVVTMTISMGSVINVVTLRKIRQNVRNSPRVLEGSPYKLQRNN